MELSVTTIPAVHRSKAITPEFLWNLHATPIAENICLGDIGGARRIRTHGTVRCGGVREYRIVD